MPSRNMIAANKAIFASLDDYCSVRGEPLANAGRPRWIRTAPLERRFLKESVLVHQLSFSPSVKLARFDFSNRAVFFSSGLETFEPPGQLRTEDLDGGSLTAFLSDVGLLPVVSPAQIRDAVEVEDKLSTPTYDGHDPVLISNLYSGIQVFSMDDLAQEESFKLFFLICLCDQRRARWIDDRLLAKLRSLAELSSLSIPYQTLCRSILDLDPSSVFLSLYRCLEAQYAYSHTGRLMAALQLSTPWIDVARTLEETLGWYPREEPSLESLLTYAQRESLEAVAAALNEVVPANSRIESFVARKVYQLRNTVVHYRPLQQKVSTDGINWNRLCESVSTLVFDVYEAISRGAAAERAVDEVEAAEEARDGGEGPA